ncbi:hypothetical protein KRP22_000766 [Phytophthora ramorum]|nr:Alanyl-tRNA editing protein Aarsd1 [Phytophthora ramorum]
METSQKIAGGGQPWDTGDIDGVPVDQVYVKDGRCVHRVLVKGGAGPPFTEGREVVASVDWARRFNHMQQHSAQHLFSAIAEKYGYDTTTWSLGEERCNVELVSMDTAAASVEAGKKAGTEMNMIPADVLEKIEVDVDECIPESVCSERCSRACQADSRLQGLNAHGRLQSSLSEAGFSRLRTR